MIEVSIIYHDTAKETSDARDLAELLDVDRYRIYEWVRDEQIPCLRTVGRILFDPEEIQQWLRLDRSQRIDINEKPAAFERVGPRNWMLLMIVILELLKY